jgi:hypothetical protein
LIVARAKLAICLHERERGHESVRSEVSRLLVQPFDAGVVGLPEASGVAKIYQHHAAGRRRDSRSEHNW